MGWGPACGTHTHFWEKAMRSWCAEPEGALRPRAGGSPYRRLLVGRLQVHGAAAAATPRGQGAAGRVQAWGALGGGHGRGRCAHDHWRGQAAPALQVPVGGHGEGVHLHLWKGGATGARKALRKGSLPTGTCPRSPISARSGQALSAPLPPSLPPSPPHTCGREVSELVEILFQVSRRLVFVCVRPVGVALCPQSRGVCEVPLEWEPSVPCTPVELTTGRAGGGGRGGEGRPMRRGERSTEAPRVSLCGLPPPGSPSPLPGSPPPGWPPAG